MGHLLKGVPRGILFVELASEQSRYRPQILMATSQHAGRSETQDAPMLGICSNGLLDSGDGAKSLLSEAKQDFLWAGRNLVWFSCGAASAVAAKLAVEKYGADDVRVIYCDTSANENADNPRFLADVEKWIGVKIESVRSEKYQTVEEVFDARQYMSGPTGAPCTVEMKKVPRFKFQWGGDVHIFGLTADETMPLCKNPRRDRIRQFSDDNHDLRLDWILAEKGITKADTLRIVEEAGIALPLHYGLGFANNNCWGCVKATSPKYWNLTRKHNPEVFARRCEQSRRIGARLVRLHGERIFLDELPPDETEDVKEDLSCGPQCAPRNGAEAPPSPESNIGIDNSDTTEGENRK